MNYALISCWKEHGGAPGMGLLRVDTESAVMEYLGTQQEDLSCNCTAWDAERGILYITNEVHENPDYPKGGGGLIYAFRFDAESGTFTQLSRVESACPCPSYVSLDKEKKYLVCANHSSFNAATRAVKGADGYWHTEVVYDDAIVGLFRLYADGSIGPMVDAVKHDRYPVSGRTLHAHPHSAVMSPDGRFFVCCDKGDSHIYFYTIDYEAERLVLCSEPYNDNEGASPRYCAFHPEKPYLFANHERDMHLTAFRYNDRGELTPLCSASALPEGVEGDTRAIRKALHGADCEPPHDGFWPSEQQGFCIHPSGKYLYDMLNGPDAVSVFEVNETDGSLQLIQTVPVEGRWVRGGAVSPDGKCFIVSCLQSGDVYSYRIGADGTLSAPVSHAVVPGGSYVTYL